jgi:hypothetical protein
VPGEESDSTAVSIPVRSISYRCAAADQSGHAGMPSATSCPAAEAWATEEPVRKWAWASMNPVTGTSRSAGRADDLSKLPPADPGRAAQNRSPPGISRPIAR